MRKKLKFLTALISAAIICSSFTVFAGSFSTTQAPYENYTYWEGVSGSLKKAVYSKAMYYADRKINAQSLGISKFSEIKDVFCTDSNETYILDSRGSKIIVLTPEYTFSREITRIDDNGNDILFSGASGIFVGNDGRIYIADTENARVLIADKDGKLIKELGVPQSALIPEGFEYRPTKIAVSENHEMYVLSDGSFYGALVFDEHYNFKGFYGSNTVKSSITEGIANLWNQLFMTDSKRENSEKSLPYQFTDLCMDKDGFIYTVTGKTESEGNVTGQIKKLSPSGISILGGDSYNYVDEGYADVKGDTVSTRVQDLLALDVDDNGYIFALDSTYGRIFVYTPESRLLTAFGGGLTKGRSLGTFCSACAIAENGGDILVCDSSNNDITLFKPTEYGKSCMEANMLTSDGDYIAAKPLWEGIHNQDSNNQIAYSGLAKAYMAEGNYELALKYAEEGYDRELYDEAFSSLRKEFMSNHFTVLFLGAVGIVALIVAAVVVIKKKKIAIVKNQQLKLMLGTVNHPFATFDTVKEKKTGSVLLATLLLLLYYAVTVAKSLFSGFSFNSFDSGSFNSMFILVRSIGMVILWTLCSWAVGALFNGKGTIRNIYIVTCYCLIPLIFSDAVYIVFSNLLTSDEGAFLGIFSTIMIMITAFYLIVGMIRIHDYSFGEFIITSILTVIGMVLIIFFVFLVGVLVQQLWGFIVTLVSEAIQVIGGKA